MAAPWWHEAIVYQIYPKSFQDSNGDGIGDLAGITARLPYLAALGVNTLWLCPIFASPMVDNGYDVSDYYAIHPDFGTLDDLKALIAAARALDIRILLDLVLNHTSDAHAWFESALRDPASPYRDWYIFREGIDGGPPNNWRSNFGGPAWTKAPDGAYYLHTFAPEQPDLNWENAAMRQALYKMIHWWMDLGVAGFRIDAICFIKKDQSFAPLPADGPDGLADITRVSLVRPGIEVFLAELRDAVFAPRGAFTVAEANGVRPEQLEAFVGPNGFFSTIFDFSYADIDLKSGAWHDVSGFRHADLRDAIFQSQLALRGVGHGAPHLENHDQLRSPNKYLTAAQRTATGKKLLGMLYFFLQGVPFIYQGQELGMENHPWASLDELDDVAARGQYDLAIAAGFSQAEALAIIAHRARDNARTPMLWDTSPHAGFSPATPWLPTHPEGAAISAAAQAQDSQSVLQFYAEMVRLRKALHPLFFDGDIRPLFLDRESLIAYERALDGRRVWVLCNLGWEAQALPVPEAECLLRNTEGAPRVQGGITLAPLEGVVLAL